jgi:hypothetical protein
MTAAQHSEAPPSVARRRNARKRARAARAVALAATSAAAMVAVSPRSWWMLAALGGFGWWARGRIDAHRDSIGETLGQRPWAIVAGLRDEYSEGERETLRMLDARVVVAIESGDVASIERLLDEVEAIVTEADAARVVHDLRAFSLCVSDRPADAARAVARAEPTAATARGWSALTRALLARTRGERDAVVSEGAERFAEHAPPVRALAAALSAPRASDAVYRAGTVRGSHRRAHESWMLRVAPDFARALPRMPSLSSAMDASWNHRSDALPIDAPRRPWRDRFTWPWLLTVGSLAALQALAFVFGAALVRAPSLGLVLVFLGPIVGLALAGALQWAAVSRARAEREARRQEHRDELVQRAHRSRESYAIERAIERGATDEAFALAWALGAPRDRALLYRKHAVALAWRGHAAESESVLARMDEDFSTFSHCAAARFEARLVSAVVAGDRAKAARYARELVDALPVSHEVERLAFAVYAATSEPALRDEALSLARGAIDLPRRAAWVHEALSRRDEEEQPVEIESAQVRGERR